MKGGAYKVRSKYPYRSEGQSRSTKKQPVIRNNQDSHFNAIHLCPNSGRQANILLCDVLFGSNNHTCLSLFLSWSVVEGTAHVEA
ncbi:hypothetical protein T05_6134 [Trichinella murrelli]|uniref:Uncharacterized protein n=1 Tax=Trichinella murrelli TaxID=144512 RepID=A0A0V0SW21_9BILA|nr:hypothetical protein T05_6134 [Trichinella murrelli]